MSDQQKESEWISLGEAAKLLGVHPTTVRNWADQGELPFRRTPGRHRRFQRSVLKQWAVRNKRDADLSGQQAAPTTQNPQILMEYALGHTRFSMDEKELQQKGWYQGLSPAGRERSRLMGRYILEALLEHLEDKLPEGQEFAKAHQIGEEYAILLHQEGLTMAQAVQAFVYFDDFLTEAVVRMIAPQVSTEPVEWSDVLRQINAFTNEILISMTNTFSRQ
ncbi:MAG: MerR family transcriptional regulator [Anaerolineales bacterium]